MVILGSAAWDARAALPFVVLLKGKELSIPLLITTGFAGFV